MLRMCTGEFHDAPSEVQAMLFQVYKESSKRAMNEQYGGEDESPPPAPGFTSPTLKLTKSSNAYMLVYVRESSWNDIMRDVSKNDIAEHVSSRLQVLFHLCCIVKSSLARLVVAKYQIFTPATASTCGSGY